MARRYTPQPQGRDGRYKSTGGPRTPANTTAVSTYEDEDPMRNELDAVYPDRQQALQAAVSLEQYEQGVSISRKADGWGLTADGRSDFVTCDVNYDANEGYLTDNADFLGDDPDDHRFHDVMDDTDYYSQLQPVKDFLNGKSDGVTVYSVPCTGWVGGGDYVETMEDCSLVADCASREYPGQEWAQQVAEYGTQHRLGNSYADYEHELHAMNSTHSVRVWQGQRPGETMLGDDQKHVSIQVRSNGHATATLRAQTEDGRWRDQTTIKGVADGDFARRAHTLLQEGGDK